MCQVPPWSPTAYLCSHIVTIKDDEIFLIAENEGNAKAALQGMEMSHKWQKLYEKD